MDSSWKKSWHTSGVMPLWNRMKNYACHILWTVHACVLKFHIWIPHGNIADPYFFLVRVISFSGVMPLWKNQNELKGIWVEAWNLVSCPYMKFQNPSIHNSCWQFKMPKFSKGHNSGKIRWFFFKFNQVIYSSSPISWPSFKPLAQIVFFLR